MLWHISRKRIPDSVVPGSTDDLRGRALLMEWAIGKGYDLYRQGYWQAAAAGIQDLVGYSLSRYRRGPIKGRYVQEKKEFNLESLRASDCFLHLDGCSGTGTRPGKIG